MAKTASKKAPPPKAPKDPTVVGHDPIKLKQNAYGVFDASCAVMHHLTTPVAFYNSQADLLVAQKRLLVGLPGNKELLIIIEAAMDALTARADSYRSDNRWDSATKTDGPRAN